MGFPTPFFWCLPSYTKRVSKRFTSNFVWYLMITHLIATGSWWSPYQAHEHNWTNSFLLKAVHPTWGWIQARPPARSEIPRSGSIVPYQGEWVYGFMHPMNSIVISCYTGWWLTYPSEKYESQLGSFFPIYGKTKNPNHQPVMLYPP